MDAPGLSRSPPQPGGPKGAAIAAIAAEQFIAPLAGENHGQGSLGGLGQLEGRQDGVVGGGVVQGGGDLGQQGPEVLLGEGGLPPVEVQRPGHPLGLPPFIPGARRIEATGKGGDGPTVEPAHQGGDGGRVDPAGQKQAIGHVGPLMDPHAVLQHRIQLSQQGSLALGRRPRGGKGQGGANLMGNQPARHHLDDGAGRDPARAVKGTLVAQGIAEGQHLPGAVGGDGRRGQARLDEGAGLRGEGQSRLQLHHIERLDAKGVADQPGATVGAHQADGVHPPQPVERRWSLLRIEVQEGFEV